jgi:hypothetical protein
LHREGDGVGVMSAETVVTRTGLGWSLDCTECGRILSDVNRDAAESRSRGHLFVRHDVRLIDGEES